MIGIELGAGFADFVGKPVRLAALVLGTGGLLSLLTSGWFDHVSVMVEYHLRQDMFRDSLHQHVALAFGSLALALCVGVPLGVAAHAFRRLGGPLLAGLNIIQTIPSLALFGLLIPLFGWVASTIPGAAAVGVAGIGRFPALVALFLYALLPVVSNTRAGLDAVSPPVHDAAVSLGMTRLQILWQVELPLALPAILAATRIVLVQNIGLAVIAGLIGGGGFGGFGRNNDNDDNGGGGIIGLLVAVIIAPLAATIIQLAISRSREYAADKGGGKICGDPLALASALEKIDYYAHHRTMPQATQATEHMYIINPLAGKDISFASLFSTHPATADRIARLREQAAQMK